MMTRTNRPRRRRDPDIEPLEQRTLLSAGAGGAAQEKQVLKAIERVVKHHFAHKGRSPQDGAARDYLMTVVEDDLTYEGVFNSSAPGSTRHARRHARVASASLSESGTLLAVRGGTPADSPPTQAQTLAAFQAAYNQALIQSAPAAAQLLAADALLAVSVYNGTLLLYEAHELGTAYAVGALSKEFQENIENMKTAIEQMMENPLFETPAGQELALTGEELALNQLVDHQPISFPTPPVVGNLPPIGTGSSPVSTPSLPPRIAVEPQSLTFTTGAGANPATQTIAISNAGGGTLHLTEKTNASWIGLINEGNSIGGSSVLVGVEVNAALLSPGTYTGSITVSAPEDPNGTQIVLVTLNVTAPVFHGSFMGTVRNDDDADGGNDVGSSFVDSYGGGVTMTLTQAPGGGYTLTFQGQLTNPSSAEEDFSANFNFYVTVQDLANIRFTTPMGDGQMLVQGAISGGTFSGTWVFQATSSDDASDSGSGSFGLSR